MPGSMVDAVLLGQLGRRQLFTDGFKRNLGLELRIPEDRPIHSDNTRPPVPGYSPTFDALP